ncbi:MAG: hypothetical protein CMK53_09325 [Proteobacteria bacterium]|jgi:hypothetical protein|nr:hypothetical protein [Pseudomonadota bacterium]MEE1577438.1 hypothetical protein [Deltaproteobacteria bacterium]
MDEMEKKLDDLKEDYRRIEAPEFMASRISAVIRNETKTNRSIIDYLLPSFALGLVLLVLLILPGHFETAKKPVSYSESKPKGFGHTMSSIPSPRISKLDEVPTAQWGRKSSDFLKSELILN